ncbi:MAG: hypothetical protein ACOYKE_13925, partial [Ferruginibacter sp.]
MKNILTCFSFLLLSLQAISQIAFINITNHNSGSGSNNLFNNAVAAGQNCYIDWDVWHPGLTNIDPCGTKTISRLILRKTGDKDPTSVVASAPIIVDGICNGKNGNNDKYYVNLAAHITTDGRYSVEIQADVVPAIGAGAYDNTNTATTWNYRCPPAYYLSGASGITGQY